VERLRVDLTIDLRVEDLPEVGAADRRRIERRLFGIPARAEIVARHHGAAIVEDGGAAPELHTFCAGWVAAAPTAERGPAGGQDQRKKNVGDVTAVTGGSHGRALRKRRAGAIARGRRRACARRCTESGHLRGDP
jgi:hypothetical protein